ncbi:MAG: hypothetical protein HYV07_00365 [Deltaproteobacteria bacterium]|nr:hypothetical protein [Deltaproteobacteria bacterium]
MKVSTGALDPRFTQIPCPVLRTLVKEDRIQVGPEGQVDLGQLQKALRGIGASDLVSKLLAHGGSNAAPVKPELLRDASRPELDIYRLRGSSLDHAGDTRVLREPAQTFSQARLDALLSLSSDGKTLSVQDLALANKLNTSEEHAGLRATGLGIAELGALLLIFGKRDENGVKRLNKDDVVSLFRDSTLPEGFVPDRVGVLDVVGVMAKMTFHRQFTVGGRAVAGLEAATDKPRMLNETSLEGLRQAMCPAGMRPKASPAVSEAEVVALHQGPARAQSNDVARS